MHVNSGPLPRAGQRFSLHPSLIKNGCGLTRKFIAEMGDGDIALEEIASVSLEDEETSTTMFICMTAYSVIVVVVIVTIVVLGNTNGLPPPRNTTTGI